MDDEYCRTHNGAEEPRRAGQQHQHKPPDPQGASQLLGGHGVPGDTRHRHHNKHRRGDDLGLHRRRAHHQTTDNGNRLSNGLGQPQARLLQDLKGNEQDDDLKGGAEGHVLLGRNDGQGQSGWDHLLMEGDHGDIEGGQQQGGEHTEVAQHRQGGGQQPVGGLVLGGLQEVAQHCRGQIAQRDAVNEDAHPTLGQPGAEPVGPLGVLDERKGGVGGGHDILLNGSGGKHPVNVDVPQLGRHLLHQMGIGDSLYI